MDAALRTRAERLASEMASQAKTAEDLNGLLRLMMKSAMERMLNTEMDVHLGRTTSQAGEVRGPGEPPADGGPFSPPAEAVKRPPNRRNGRSRKTVQGELGELTLATPRDRNGTFEPQLIPKDQPSPVLVQGVGVHHSHNVATWVRSGYPP